MIERKGNQYRRSLRNHVSNIIKDLVPYGVDLGIGVLYEIVDWGDEALADLLTVASGGTGGALAQGVEEGVDNLAINFTNKLYRIAGDLYERLNLMTPQERRTRDNVIKGASYAERAQIGPLDVIPAYAIAAAGYHGIRSIKDTREAIQDLGEWLRNNVYELKEKTKRKEMGFSYA